MKKVLYCQGLDYPADTISHPKWKDSSYLKLAISVFSLKRRDLYSNAVKTITFYGSTVLEFHNVHV